MNKKHGPWTIKKSTIKYKNRWINVREDVVTRPDGKPGIFGVVEMVPGASVLPMDNEGNVYLTKEFRYGVGQDSIEVVSGGIDKHETPIQAAKRELKEELGFTAKKIIKLGKIDPFTSVVISPAYLFLATDIRFTETKLEGTEQIKMIKIPLKKAVELVMKSKITHGQTCVLILKAWKYLSK